MTTHHTKLGPACRCRAPAQRPVPPPLPASPPTTLQPEPPPPPCAATCAATPTYGHPSGNLRRRPNLHRHPNLRYSNLYITTQMNDMPLDLSQSVLQVQTPMAEAPLSPPSCTL